MKTPPPLSFSSLAAVAIACTLMPLTLSAAFVGFDTFDSYGSGSLNGDGPLGNTWTALATTTVANTGGTDNVINLASGTTGGVNYRSLTPAGLSIVNASTAATVYWNFTLTAVGVTGSVAADNWNFILTDLATPTDTAGTSEVQSNYDSSVVPTAGSPSTTSVFRARNGGAFKALSTTGTVAGDISPQAGVQYNVWFVVDNAVDTYQVWMQSDSASAGLLTPTEVFGDDGTGGNFGFRNGAATTISSR